MSERSTRLLSTFALFFFLTVPAHVQSADNEWTGIYVGVSDCPTLQDKDTGSSITFDANLDGQFGDVVRTGPGANIPRGVQRHLHCKSKA